MPVTSLQSLKSSFFAALRCFGKKNKNEEKNHINKKIHIYIKIHTTNATLLLLIWKAYSFSIIILKNPLKFFKVCGGGEVEGLEVSMMKNCPTCFKVVNNHPCIREGKVLMENLQQLIALNYNFFFPKLIYKPARGELYSQDFILWNRPINK